MRETKDERLQTEHISVNALQQLQKTLSLIAKATHSSRDPLTCSVCHKPITLETKGICADEYGKAAHTACYVQQVIASNTIPVAPENRA